MKKFFLIVILFAAFASAQPPQGISHRGTVYNTLGALVINSTVKIRISILDNSITGSEVYSETHTIITNSVGQYSLNIGKIDATNTQNSPTNFSEIKWGENLKFLKVEIDPTGVGTSFPIIGTNQLMSVPYALYSLGSGDGVTMLRNIDELRNFPVELPRDENRSIYIKGYHEVGDGGDGFFIYKKEETFADVGGIYIKPENVTGVGRWARQYAGPLNIIYFGVQKAVDSVTEPPGLSNGKRINKAIKFVHDYNLKYVHGNVNHIALTKTPKDMTLYFPSGSYFIDTTLVLYPEINIKGDRATRFWPTFGIEGEYLFEIQKGFVLKLNIENIEMDFGHSQNGLGGIHLNAIDISGGDGGGPFCGTFKSIKMFRPTGHGIYLEGPDPPLKAGVIVSAWNQYLHFEDLFIERQNGSKNNCLKITGANVNIQFESCNFAIPFLNTKPEASDPGTNVYIGSSGSIPQVRPSQISFINCASGGGGKKGVFHAFKIENSENITLENCWFEDTEVAISVVKSKGINILNSRFANAAGLGSGNISITNSEAACIDVKDSFVTIERNHVTVSEPLDDRIKKELFIRGLGEDNTINSRNNSFDHIRLSETYGITQTIYTDNIPNYNTNPPFQMKKGIETGGKKFVLVRIGNGIDTIERINSTISTGETLFIRAEDGNLTINEWDPVAETDGKNIYLSGKGSILLRQGQGAYFIKTDGVNGIEKCAYQLISVSN